MPVIAYLRTSTDKQDLDSQKLAVMEYANREGLHIDEFVKVELSTRNKRQGRDLDIKISIAAISRLVDASPTTVRAFIKSRGLEAGELLKRM